MGAAGVEAPTPEPAAQMRDRWGAVYLARVLVGPMAALREV
jgi:hypothetical protein